MKKINNPFIRIENHKFVLKAAQAVWSANKYFVLACSQQHYLQIRRALRPDNPQLKLTYDILDDVSQQFSAIKTDQLPQLANALYHIAGYLKNKLPNEERQKIDNCIRTNPSAALQLLEKHIFHFNIEYLQMSTLWQKHRTKPFYEVPVELRHKGIIYQENQLHWKGDYVLLKQKIE